MNNANDSLVYPWHAGQKALLAFSQALAAINSKFKPACSPQAQR